MIRVITIDREYGSGGADIAKALADRLGWKLWDQALTNEIARYMECDCRVVEEHEEKRARRPPSHSRVGYDVERECFTTFHFAGTGNDTNHHDRSRIR